MYHAKKFSTMGLVPHKTQGAEQLSNMGAVAGPTVSNSAPSGGNGKQRLRWTSDLHDRFVDAIAQLGGPDSEYLSIVMCLFFTFVFVMQVETSGW